MANISLGQVRDLWKRVSDWISGATADKPGVTVYGSDDGGTTRRAVSTDESGALKTQLTGNIASDSGLAANRPDAASVRAGFVYYSVDTDVIEYSDGAKWVVM